MHEPCFSKEPRLVRDLQMKNHKVQVSIWYGVNTGPEDSGFLAIRDIGADPRVKGFPVFKAQVDCSAFGYEDWFGWIQMIVHLRTDGSIEDWSPDPLPMMRDRGVPFAEFGYLPTLYDAPFWPERPRIHWRADTFLCPLVIRRPSEEDILPLAGFRWGFTIPKQGGEPELLPLEGIGAKEWNVSLPQLRFWFPSWRFARWSE